MTDALTKTIKELEAAELLLTHARERMRASDMAPIDVDSICFDNALQALDTCVRRCNTIKMEREGRL